MAKNRKAGLEAIGAGDDQPEKICFVLMPFAGESRDWYEVAIRPAVEGAGFRCKRADEIFGAGPITEQIFRNIFDADVLLVDLSGKNANVFYELGVAHALGKPVVLIAQDIETIPFDLRSLRVIVYQSTPAGIAHFTKAVQSVLGEVASGDSHVRPLLGFMPELTTVTPSEVTQLRARITELEHLLAERDQQFQSMQVTGGRDASDLLALAGELRSMVSRTTDELLARVDDRVVTCRVENEHLKAELTRVQSIEREYRVLKASVLVNPHWKGRDFDVDPEFCFLLMPFREAWSDEVWTLLDKIIGNCGFRCQRADEKDGRIIMDDIWESVCRARVIVADLTAKNPNVTYEVGLADVLGKDVILLSQNPSDVPFDFLGVRLITYENSFGGVNKLSADLERRLYSIRNSDAHPASR
jgi:hypothetical protein